MKRTRALLFVVVLLIGTVPGVFSQAKGALSITCNVTGARVYLNGEIAGYAKPTFATLLKPGQYQLKVSMQGYKDFVTTIQMTSNPMNLNVNLEPAVSLYTLSVTANVAGAQVYINNVASGNAPLSRQLAPGSYSIRVSAPGFEDYVATVVVNGNTSHAAMLQPIRHQVTINSNVNGAQVYVNNAYVGTTPYTGTYAPGSYTVRLTAPGYQDASTVINLNRSDSITIVLQPAFATVNIYLNPASLDPQNRNAIAQLKVFIDGNMQNGTTFQLPAGRHNIRITSGSFSASGDFDIAAGRTYTIEPVFSIQMR